MQKAFFKATSLVLAIILTVISLPTAAVVGAALEVLGETPVLLSGANTTPNVTVYDVIYTTYTENGVIKICITKYKGTKTELVFPDKLNNMVIGEIGSYAFSYCSSLTNIILPESITEIDSSAFYGCRSLTSITIPDSVTYIGEGVFSGCSTLKSITVENGNTVYHSDGNCLIETASKTLITGCKNSIIPADGSVTSIGRYAFSSCSSLTSVTIPEGVTSIGEDAFEGCSSLTSITIPESVTSIGDNAFQYCSSLTSITIPESVTYIGDGAFEYCSSLTSITIPESVTYIGDGAFLDCNLLEYNVYDNAKYLGNETNPYVVLIGATSTDITSCTINTDTKIIVGSAFQNCSSLEFNVYDNAEYLGNEANPYMSLISATSTEIASCAINAATKIIADSAFLGCSLITSINITESVTSIGARAFGDCSSLTSITIPKGVTTIGDYAFSYCRSLTSITLPDGVTSIGGSAFSSCDSLTSINIPKGVTVISGDAFLFCDSLTSITIPEGVTSIGEGAFEVCSSLTSITIPAGVTSIGESAFWNCSSLTSITIPESVTYIGSSAFCCCSSLTSITIPAGVPSIGSYAFSDCYKLTSISIPESVTYIGEGAFRWCSSLTNITIPEGVTSIGDSAFWDCSSLISIIIPRSVTSIGDYAFYRCTALKTIYGVKGSYAETYANENGYTFIALPGATLSGTIKLPKSMDGVTVLLYSSDMSDDDIRADMKKSNPEKALAFTASMGEISSEGDTYSRQFTFNGVTEGSYKLAIRKAGAYTVEIKSVTTEQTNIDVGAMSIGIMGDADGNGEINSVDYSICKRIVLQSLKNATERNRLASDVNGNGDVDTTDYAMIKRHVLGTYTIG